MTDYYYIEREVRKTRELVKERYMSAFGDKVADMLAQLADMLAEREKAEPFTWVLEFNDPDPQVDFSEGSKCPKGWEGRAFPLYTHPAAQPSVTDGPGTSTYIHQWFLDELEKRIPISHSPSLSSPPEPKYLAKIDDLLAAQDGRSRE